MPNGTTNLMRNIRRPAPQYREGTEFFALNREQRRALRFAQPRSPRFEAAAAMYQLVNQKENAR